MKLTPKQQHVLDLLAENGEMTLAQLVDGVGWWYYHNANKYIGMICSRLVDRGRIKRVRRGVYRINEKYGIEGTLFEGM